MGGVWRRCCRWSGLGLAWLVTATAVGEVITPVAARATSEFGAIDVFGDGNFSSVHVESLIDASGLIDVDETPDDILDDFHDNEAGAATGWHAGDFDAGIQGGLDGDDDWLTPPPVAEQQLIFDFDMLYGLTEAYIWQQNQGPLFGAPPAETRGVDEFRIFVSQVGQGDAWTLVGDYTLEVEFGTEPVPAQVIEFDATVDARRVRFDLISAHSGLDHEFVGLSEVRFVGEPIGGTLGDFNLDGILDAQDIDQLTDALITQDDDSRYDVNGDGVVDHQDRIFWVEDLKETWFGDANLDGTFDSSDFVITFSAGEYEDGIESNSRWQTGDWNGDQEFDSGDFVTAFGGGGFEQGERPATAAAVPEPHGLTATLLTLGLFWGRRFRRSMKIK